MADTRCGLIALAGAPNAGKSSLLNALIGEKVAIVSPKPNTTRLSVRGVLERDNCQLVFMDTPGLSEAADGLNRLLAQQARGAMADADVVCMLVDASKRLPDFSALGKGASGQKILLLTKVDLVKPKDRLLPLLATAAEAGFDAVVPVSIRDKRTLEGLVKELARRMPEGPWLFPAGQATDVPLPLRLAELTREQAMLKLHDEVPYGVAVLPLEIDEDADPMLVHQTVLVANERHKGMVLGKGGQMLKSIGSAARAGMEKILGRRVRLELRVQVDERWAERSDLLRQLGVTE